MSIFVARVACDVGGGKLNTGVEFERRPTVADLVRTIELLYTTELRLHRGDAQAKFRCVSLMVARPTADGSGVTWEEVVSVDQLDNGGQYFAFDWTSPGSSQGPIPPVQFVVTSEQIINAAAGHRAQHQRTLPAGVSQTPVDRQAPQTISLSTPRGGTDESSRVPPVYAVPPAERPSRSKEVTALAAPSPNISRTSVGGKTESRLPPEAREYLFQQLSRESNGRISAHRLHGIFVDYGLAFPTEVFSDMTHGVSQLDQSNWSRLESEYGPVVDALYDRIATRSAAEAQRRAAANERGSTQSVAEIRDALLQVEIEEARLLAEQAALRKRAAELQRALREAEDWERNQQVLVANRDDRAKEWDTLQKFVALRRKQEQLRREEAQLSHELSLL